MGEKILIVEDDFLVASDIKFMLESFGYRITGIANTAVKAIELFKSVPPDLVVCDINLRTKRSGIDFVAKTRKIAFVPVVYITAYSDEKTISNAAATMPESYLIKPFTRIQLRTSVKFALEKTNGHRTFYHDKKDIPEPTTRELEILQRLQDGLNSRNIAEQLSISVQTVQTHRKKMMSKYKVNSTLELLELARKYKLVN